MTCQHCGSSGPFVVTPDRVLHVTRGHVGAVIHSDGGRAEPKR